MEERWRYIEIGSADAPPVARSISAKMAARSPSTLLVVAPSRSNANRKAANQLLTIKASAAYTDAVVLL